MSFEKHVKKVSLINYGIRSDKAGFQHATLHKPTETVDIDFWNELVQKALLTLQGMAVLHDQMYPKSQPDTLRNRIEPDGTVSVRAKRAGRGRMIISDGEGYTVEIFGPGEYRQYEYSNPREYAVFYTDIPDLARFVTILNRLAIAFLPKH